MTRNELVLNFENKLFSIVISLQTDLRIFCYSETMILSEEIFEARKPTLSFILWICYRFKGYRCQSVKHTGIVQSGIWNCNNTFTWNYLCNKSFLIHSSKPVTFHVSIQRHFINKLTIKILNTCTWQCEVNNSRLKKYILLILLSWPAK